MFKIKTQPELRVAGCVFGQPTPMHEVTPKVVAMAVSTVMTMLRILLQRVLSFMMFDL